MEKTIRELIPPQHQNKVGISEDFDHIELTEEELQLVIREAKKKKAAEIARREYAEFLRKPIQYASYTAAELYNLIQQKAKLLFPGFALDEYNIEIMKMLCFYFTGDKTFETLGEEYSLSKGIFLYGNVGCGKTSIMRLFSENQVQSYSIVSCRKLAAEYSNNGYQAIERYNNLIPRSPDATFGHKDLGICFDDLGTEENKKHFGNETSVMAEVILNRYDKHYLLAGKTHMTSNLTGEMIKEMYGSRVSSRMREMFNVISFANNAPDRRK